MATYAVLLRGVNVGGRTLKMADLRALLDALGYEAVRTYLQSGNAVLTTPKGTPRVATEIEGALAAELGAEVAVLVRTHAELTAILAANPFAEDDPTTLHATFLSGPVDEGRLVGLEAERYRPDEWRLGDGVLYLRCPEGYGRTKLHNSFWERRLRLVATTRNWRTVNQLAELTAR